MKENYKLSEEEHERILNNIMQDVFKGAKKSERPTIFIMGGQPGAGKSTLINRLINSDEGRECLIINADEYRTYHPKIKEIYEKYPDDLAAITDMDVRDWTQRIFAKAIENRNNIIFEGTMRTNQICNTIKDLHQKGYDVNIHVMAVNFFESKLSTYSRFEEAVRAGGMPRHTPPEAHDETYDKMLDTLQQIEDEGYFNRITIHGRNKEVNLSANGKSGRISSVLAILNHREKIWSKSKYNDYQEQADRVINLMQQRQDERYVPQVVELKSKSKKMTDVPAKNEISNVLASLLSFKNMQKE